MQKVTSDLKASNRLGPYELRRIRATEMYGMQVEGWHAADIASIYKITLSCVYSEIKAIPEDIKRQIEDSPMRERNRAIAEIMLNQPGRAEERAQREERAGRMVAKGSAARRAERQRDREAIARELYRLKVSGLSYDQIAADRGTTRKKVTNAIQHLRNKDRWAIDREAREGRAT